MQGHFAGSKGGMCPQVHKGLEVGTMKPSETSYSVSLPCCFDFIYPSFALHIWLSPPALPPGATGGARLAAPEQ